MRSKRCATLLAIAVLLGTGCRQLSSPLADLGGLSMERELGAAAKGKLMGRGIAIRLLPARDGVYLDDAGGITTQAVSHRWEATDVFRYEVILEAAPGGAPAPLGTLPVTLWLDPKGADPEATATFTNLKSGVTYQLTVRAWGNAGGTSPARLLNQQTPAQARFSFPEGEAKVEATELRVTLDPVDFEGAGEVAMLPEEDGAYAPPAGGATGEAE